MPEGPGFRIEVDQELCIGSGLCTTSAPHTFDQDDQTAKVLILEVGGDPIEAALSAAEACPMRAITITVTN